MYAALQQTLFIVSGSPSNPRGGKPNAIFLGNVSAITLVQMVVTVCLTVCRMPLYHSKKGIIDSILLEEQHETKHTCEVRFRSKNTLTEMAGISIRSWYTVGF